MEAPPNINLKIDHTSHLNVHGDSEPKTQKDLVELTRKYRHLEGDRKAFAEEAQVTIRRQNQIIERLTNENNQLRDRVAEATHRAGGNAARSAEAEALLAKRALFEQKISQEKEAIRSLERKLKAADKVMNDLRKERAAAEAARPTAATVEKHVRLLENRLQQTSCKYNDVLAENRRLRAAIENLRSEHIAFEKIHSGLVKEADQKVLEMTQLMERAREEFKNREETQEQLARLREQAQKEAQAFQEEWTELGRILERDARRRQLQQQQMEQQSQHLQDQAAAKLALTNRTDMEAEAADRADDEATYERAFKTILESHCYPAINKALAEANGDQEPHYATMRLTEGIVNHIVDCFIAGEEHNFSLFTLTNELRAELEAKEEDLFKLKNDLIAAKLRKQEADANMKSEVQSLENQLAAIKATGEGFEQQFDKLTTSMNNVYELIEHLFKESGCETISGISAISEDIQEGFVTSENVVMHLSAIESAIDALMGKLLLLVNTGTITHADANEILHTDLPNELVSGLAPSAVALYRTLNKPQSDQLRFIDLDKDEV
ncbi:Outer dynein arm-docking complex subunit 2 [Giardia muris]|uniref:Outer dynein arm-docking complex subunit 2 n=1 Tax=Giardia muris TaxID=5742 RepID=A0A4Z1TCY8_GIAMU|nr:Outer dynein arm-docking complex subunit 2 [Giardia muris]|eukprot:TNJ30381.1 Outer dynein arm-docking complex subunit 2 [Giardia muris]